MAREYFVFHRNYFEVVKTLDEKARLEMYDAICEFALNQNESKIEGVANVLFSLIKPDILKGLAKYKNGVKGGRGKKANGKLNESKMKADEKLTESKEETTFPLKKTTKEKDGQKEKSKKTNTPFVQEETPLYPPKGSGAQDKFFSVYCQFKKFANGEYPQIDFTKLMEEFEKSASLRKTFSWQVILDSYDSIIAGNFRDKVDGQAEGREYIADRERHYASIRTEEEKKVENIVKKLMTIERYAEIERRMRALPIEEAKAEVKGDKLKLAKLTQERNRLRMERNCILSANGLEEDDIVVRVRCHDCNDTGYLEDGTMCGCYKGAKE
jgi:hypothetical protein